MACVAIQVPSSESTRRRECQWTGCHEESTVRCKYHKKCFCPAHADEHTGGMHCHWGSSPPLFQERNSAQLEFKF